MSQTPPPPAHALSPPEGLERIAILGSRGFPSTYGGYETLVRYLVEDWTKRGIEVTVYCRERPAGKRTWSHEGVRCRWTPGIESVSASTLSYGLTNHLDASFRDFDAALVVNVANGYFLPFLNLRKIPVAINTDGIEWERGKWGTLARKVFRNGAVASARFADVLIADSVVIAEIWRETFGVESEFVPYGAPVLDLHQPTDRIEELGLRPGEYRLVVARMVPENNVDLSLDGMLATAGENVIVGTGKGGTPLENRLADLDRQGRIRWLGHVADQEQLNQLWAHCGLYLHGHSVGGTNPSLLQAMGAGAPVIALDTRFNREVIADEEQLYPTDAGALAELIGRAQADPSLREKWSRRGQETVSTRYSWADVSQGYLDALALAKSRRNRRFPAR
jgi:glycosyltransferase involved in cell wall biosynthesis